MQGDPRAWKETPSAATTARKDERTALGDELQTADPYPQPPHLRDGCDEGDYTMFEINVTDRADTTSSGTLRISLRDALILFRNECNTLTDGMSAALYDITTDEIVATSH